MIDYTYNDFKMILGLIEKFNHEHGRRTKGIALTQINEWFFDGYKNLMTYVEIDRQNIENNKSERRHNKHGLYGKWSLNEIVKILLKAFEIPEGVLSNEIRNFSIDEQVVAAVRKKNLGTKPNDKLIYLIGSTYQGKQLKVAPRSIFEINLKKKTQNVTFYYYGTKSKKPIKTYIGSLSGMELVYMNFQDTPYKKMYILKKGTVAWDKVTYLKGTYIGDDDQHPMAGAIFCEKVKDLETAEHRLHQPLETGIQYQLLYTQFREKEVISESKPLTNHHFMVAADAIKKTFQGTYYGVYLSTQAYHSILTAKLELKEDGSVVFYGNHNLGGEEGWIYLSGNQKKLFLRFKYNEKLDIFKYFITLTHTGDRNRYYGSYGGGSKFDFLPETGRIIFMKIPEPLVNKIPIERINVRDENLLNDFLHHPVFGSFNFDAVDFLLGKPLTQVINDFSDTPALVFSMTKFDNSVNQPVNQNYINSSEYPFIPNEFIGVYKAYLIQRFNVNPEFRLQKVALEFKKDKTVFAKSVIPREYTGMAFQNPRNNKLCFYLSSENGVPELHHTLEPVNWEKSKIVLRGTYTGTVRTAGENPVGGRILLIKDEEASSIEDIQVCDFDLSDALDMKKLEKEEPRLLNYFLGLEDKDNMVEGYGFFRRSHFLPITNTEHLIIQNQVSGFYLSFRILTDLKKISIIPLCIDNWGNVKMKSTQKANYLGELKEYSGICDINNSEVLSLKFHSHGGDDLYALSKFNKSNNPIDEEDNKIFMGTFSSSNSNKNRTFACKQILIFQNKEFNQYQDFNPIIVQIPFYPQKPSDVFNHWNKKYKGILDYLIGDEYNMIRMSRGPRIKTLDDGNGFKKKINYGEIFFIAGKDYFRNGDIILAKDTWYNSILNGFRDNAKIEKLKNENDEAWKVFMEAAEMLKPR